MRVSVFDVIPSVPPISCLQQTAALRKPAWFSPAGFLVPARACSMDIQAGSSKRLQAEDLGKEADCRSGRIGS